MFKLLGCSMVTVGQLVNSADLPQERKEPVKQVLLQYPRFPSKQNNWQGVSQSQ